MTHVQALPGVKPYVFELARKDGYLATNSLLLDAVLVARAYGELNGRRQPMPVDITALQVGEQSVQEWVVCTALHRGSAAWRTHRCLLALAASHRHRLGVQAL